VVYIYDSRLIFDGPHKSFTKADNGMKTDMSNAVFLIKEKIYEYIVMESDSPCFLIMTNRKKGITVNPYPINEEKIQECNIGIIG